MTGVDGTAYYGCVQGVDLAGNTSAWVPSASTVLVSLAPPVTSPAITIQSGAGTVTSIAVTLTLGATGATGMYVTNVAGCASGGAWEAYASSKAWMLPQIAGTHFVYVKYRNSALQESSCVNDSVIYMAPTSSIAGGSAHTCALIPGGIVKCWGENGQGELGNGSSSDYGLGAAQTITNAQVVNLGGTAIQIAAGKHAYGDSYSTSCALLSNGQIKCWGYNAYGQLGRGASGSIFDPSAISTINLGTGLLATQVVVGGGQACALISTGAVKCWGKNNYGQLGLGDTVNRGLNPTDMGNYLPAINLGTGRTAIKLAAGGDHICALLDNFTAKCWGNNFEGEAGQGHTSYIGNSANQMADYLPAINLGTGKTAVHLAAGSFHTCAILNDGSVKCWGLNDFGQLGVNSSAYSLGSAPNQMGDFLPTVPLGVGRRAIDLAVGSRHTCALLDDYSVKCWGYNGYGQLGVNNTYSWGSSGYPISNSTAAINFGGYTPSALAVGEHFNCAILGGDHVTCWGWNANGALGMASGINSLGTGAGDLPGNLQVQLFMPLPSIYITSSVPSVASMGGVSGADFICNTDSAKPAVPPTYYKAIIAAGSQRRACSSSNCSTGGAGENIDWPLAPNTTYVRPDQTVIGTTNASGIFDPLTNAFSTGNPEFWTGFGYGWETTYDCSSWTTSSSGTWGQVGVANNPTPPLFGGYAQTCDRSDVLACAETAQAPSLPVLSSQCYQHYTTLTDANRNVTNNALGSACDSSMGSNWYRFSGAAGIKMPTSAPAVETCGTYATGWMSGVYPATSDGVVSRLACFNWSSDTCYTSTTIQVVNCGTFYLFQLPSSPICYGVYCGTN